MCGNLPLCMETILHMCNMEKQQVMHPFHKGNDGEHDLCINRYFKTRRPWSGHHVTARYDSRVYKT